MVARGVLGRALRGPMVALRRYRQFVAEHDYEARCACGNEWRVRLEYDDDVMATCIACGADTFDLADIGEVHSAGRDVEWIAPREAGHS